MRCTNRRIHFISAVVLSLPLAGCLSPGARAPARELILEYGTPSEPLSCPSPTVAARPDTQMIGLGGGRLRSGTVELIIPPGALLSQRRLILHQDTRQGVSANVDAEGPLQFQNNLSGRLIFDVRGCDQRTTEDAQGWWVWRLNPVEGHSQKLSTVITPNRAITAIDSTSRFLIAN